MDYKEYNCQFVKQYIEPTTKYNIFSFSVFYPTKYIRHFTGYTKDISIQRQNQFLYNLTLNIQNIERGFFGKDWYIRIYYDKSLFQFILKNKKPWLEFMEKYKKNKYVQLVEFKCSQFANKSVNSSHINLFGTIPRLYPLFEKNDLLETVVLFDADNMITKDYFDEIIKFKKSKYDYNSFCSPYEFSYYKNNNAINADNCYLRCGMLSVNKKLPSQLWNYILYQLKTFEDKHFSNLIDKLFEYHSQLMPEKKIKTYKEFEYGIDEILLNYYFKKFFIENNFKMRVVRYRPHILIIVNTIITYLKSYYSKDKTLVQTFYKNVLKEKYKNNVTTDSDSFNKLFYLNLNLDSEYEDVKKYNDILKNELKLLEKINLPKVIICFIKNLSKDDYNKINSFNDYFYSYNTPKYVM